MTDTLSWLIPKTLSSEHVKICECSWEENTFSDEMFTGENILLPENIKSSVLKRRCEYFYGRLCARDAIRKFRPGFNESITANEDRSPKWPSGIIGSISHCGYFAICICGMECRILAIGVDAEDIIHADLSISIASSIVESGELELRSFASWPFETRLTLAFSAKESLYKALYPRVQKFFGFRSVKVVEVDAVSQSFTLRLMDDLCWEWQRGMLFKGRFTFQPTHSNFPGRVVTAIILSNSSDSS